MRRPTASPSADAPIPWWRRNTLTTVLGFAVLGGLLGDFLAAPGLSGLARGILSAVTFGSTNLRDAAYSSAALDPYRGPAILAMLMVLRVAIFGYGTVIGEMASQFRGNVEEPDFVELELDETEIARVDRSIRRSSWIIGILAGLLVAALVISALFTTAAVDIRRAFFANLAICAPYLSPDEEEMLRARFASMTSKAEYRVIEGQLRAVATENGAKLVELDLW